MVDLRKIRQAARMSQVEICGLTDISRPRLSAAENGYLELSQDELVSIRAVIAEEPGRRADKIREALAEGAIPSNGTAEAMADQLCPRGGIS